MCEYKSKQIKQELHRLMGSEIESKPVTAVAAMILWERGQINLDASDRRKSKSSGSG